jgi:hypothetical protein
MTLLILAAVAGLVVVLAGVTLLPRELVTLDLGGQAVTPAERLAAINNVRTTLFQALGGLVLGLGVYATWRRLRINEEELRISRDVQITERYSRAVEHLGHDSLDVRMGGIYALERIAQNSATDRDSIVAVLCAYTRGHSPWPPTLTGQLPVDTAPEDLPTLAVRGNDVQTAIRTLCRLQKVPGEEPLSLPRTDLRSARLNGLYLRGSYLGDSTLVGARIRDADLGDVILRNADLRFADLSGADLQRSDLRGADFRGCVLVGTQFTDARADTTTSWPDGFDLANKGLISYNKKRPTTG